MSTPTNTLFTQESSMEAWVSKHGRNILYAIAGVALLVVICVQLSRSQQAKAQGDYKAAQSAFIALESSGEGQARTDALTKLREILARRPDLATRYQGILAQELLANQQAALALPYAEAVLKRHNLPLYHDFAQTTLLIAQGQYAEGLAQTEALQTTLASQTTEEAAMLRNFVQLRLVALHQQLKQPAQEKAAIATLRTQLETATAPDALTSDKPEYRASQEFVTLFRSGSVNLLDYLRAREAELG